MLKRLNTIDDVVAVPKALQKELNGSLCDLVIHYCEAYCETSVATYGDKCYVGGHQECPGICDGAGWFINVWSTTWISYQGKKALTCLSWCIATRPFHAWSNYSSVRICLGNLQQYFCWTNTPRFLSKAVLKSTTLQSVLGTGEWQFLKQCLCFR